MLDQMTVFEIQVSEETNREETSLKLRELINQKLEWLTEAHDQKICQKIVAICQAFGKRVPVLRRQDWLYFVYDVNGISFHSIVRPNYIYGHNAELAAWVFIDGVEEKIVNLAYIDDIPKFPTNRGLIMEDVEKTPYIFIPGQWTETLEANYLRSSKIVTQKSISEIRSRTRLLAAQLLIDPRVEV